MASDIPLDSELQDGCRFSWRVWPSSYDDASAMVVPLSAMYCPLKKIDNWCKLPYRPVSCKRANCHCVLNPFCIVDYVTKVWVCPFCHDRNPFPANYSEISEQQKPAELVAQCTTVEYQIPTTTAPPPPPVFILAVDAVIEDEEMESVQEGVLKILEALPDTTHIGLMSFGRDIQIFELGFTHCIKSQVIAGAQQFDPLQLFDVLGISASSEHGPGPKQSRDPLSRFILPLSQCRNSLLRILSELRRDSWPCPPNSRRLRCTGTAVAVGISLLDATSNITKQQRNSHLMVFTSGPCTQGPGQVVGVPLSETIRSHTDLANDRCEWHQPAVKYYDELARKAITGSHSIDIFACSLDQCGVAEMKSLSEKTGGYLVCDDRFKSPVFLDTLCHIFASDENIPQMSFGAITEVLTSRDVRICGAIGPCTSLSKPAPFVGDNEIGIGGTHQWNIGGLDPSTCLAFYFEIDKQVPVVPPNEQRQTYIQFRTSSRDFFGNSLLRVTTVALPVVNFASEAGFYHISGGFDQEAAAVLVARLAVYRMSNEFGFDCLRWLDLQLIHSISKFAEISRENFSLPPQFSFYPQFMFHLRRSQFIQIFNASPDETTCYRSYLMRENVTNSLIMIQPTLQAYSLEEPPIPVLLDVEAATPNRILLLDTYFSLVVYHGDVISQWKLDGLQNQPEYEYLRDLLDAPLQDAQLLMASRFLVPRFIVCDHGSGNSRFIMAKLNPSVTHQQSQQGVTPSVFTEDVSLNVFLEHLRRVCIETRKKLNN